MNLNDPSNNPHNRTAQAASDAFGVVNLDTMLPDNNRNIPASYMDTRSVSYDRIHPQQSRHAEFETTADGNVLIVQPSFDDNCKTMNYSPSKNSAEYQDRCPPQEGKEDYHEPRNTSPPSPAVGFVNNKHTGRHTRDLSAHFFDATTLNRDDSNDSADTFKDGPSKVDTRKHRRMMSGDVSNPSTAHRRLNSIGTSASVQRRHQREHSAGLEILSAAADFSREELARASSGRTEMNHGPDHGMPFTRLPQGPCAFPPVAHHMPPPQARRYSVAPDGVPPSEYGYLPYHPSYHIHHGRPDSYQYPVQYPTQHSMNPVMNKPRQPDAYHSKPDDSARSLNTQGSQTFVTAMAVGGNKTVRPNIAISTPRDLVPSQITQHHRRMSSFSSLGIGTLFGTGGATPEREPSHPLKDSQSHHRSTSSSVSFLNAFDVAGMDGNPDDTFLRNLQESTSAYAPAFCKPVDEVPSSASQQSQHSSASDSDQPKQLASGGTSKRIRRKCTVAGCANRVVQGGLCISHGAKRKTCNHPGCTKNVKKAGLCSTHGPARKRCETPGCPKVAVQGGRCIAHGAKKKLCSHENCPKQAILAGMCKKHHDQAKEKKPSHARGLSIFHDISADAVQSIINADAVSESPTQSWQR